MKDLIALDMLDIEQCQAIAAQVLKMKAYAINRNGFYTLGAATYQDNPLAYPAIANAFNLLLASEFGYLYNQLMYTLSKHLGVKVGRVHSGVALPSFHIFDCTSSGQVGSIHIDEPYEQVGFDFEWDKPFSFTVPVLLPALGGGIEFWPDFTSEDLDSFVGNEESLPEPIYTPYSVGKLYLHDGKTPHRIANPHPIPSDEFRITLQGHGVHTAEGAVVYF